MIGPYWVKELVELFYRLELSTSMKIHNMFHSNLLQPAANNPLPDQHNDLPLPIVVDNEEEWKIDDILDAKYEKGKKLLF